MGNFVKFRSLSVSLYIICWASLVAAIFGSLPPMIILKEQELLLSRKVSRQLNLA